MLTAAFTACLLALAPARPNVVVILADDLGYGDVGCYAPGSSLATPHLDRLATEGMRFTDAHSGSAVCTPTRYGLMTGRYAWRTSLKSGVLGGYSRPLIRPERVTIAEMFRAAGYETAAIGKWHLGLDIVNQDGQPLERMPWSGDPGVDFAAPFANGPTAHGFDSFFGICASLDMAPYVYLRDDRFTMVPTETQPARPFPDFVREGPRATDFRIETVLDRLTREAVAVIERERSAPLFLYFALTAPHKPATPHAGFSGRSGLGPYGDLVQEVDGAVGAVVAALESSGMRENTLLIVTSDNGSFMYRYDDARPDHVDDASVQGYLAQRHRSNASWRGTKADVWEGGHRVPFIACWPAGIAAGTVCDRTICHVDILATGADLAGVALEAGVAEDSHALTPLFAGDEAAFDRAPVVHHSAQGMFAVRDGRWKLVLGDGSGGREAPRGKPFVGPYRLFDLVADPGETTDVAARYPEIFDALTVRAELLVEPGRVRKSPDGD